MRPSTRRWSVSLAGVYFLLGFVGATWFSRIPTEQSRLGLSSGTLGVALLGLPLGSFAVSVVVPRVLSRLGSRRVVQATLPLCGAALALLPLADRLVLLLLGLVVLGATTGGLDVAMNANGLALQDEVGSSVFGRLHALWSLGGFAGAGLGGLLTAAHVAIGHDLPFVGLVVAGVGLVVSRGLHESDDITTPDTSHPSWSRNPTVLLLAGIALAALVVEVAAADWGGVYLRRSIGSSPGTAAAAYSAFALPHFAVRILGDPVVDRAGRRLLLTVALVIAATGFVVVVVSHDAGLALAGLALAGAGVGLVVPVAFGAAGSVPGVPAGAGVATAAGVAYVGWTAAPPVIGGLASVIGLRLGLLFPVVLAAAAALTVGLRRSV
jgi:MFS family permease